MINTDRRLTRRLTLHLFFATLFILFALSIARADELAVWNFNDSDLNVDHGTGTLTSNFNVVNILFAAGTTTNARLGDIAGSALSLQGGTSNANNGRNITLNVSTLGFTNIVISFATQGTSTGFTSNQLQYSLDGITFLDFGAPYVPATAFGAIPVVFTLSSIAGLNNNPNAVFRIIFNGATSSTGNNRIDNLVVEGTSMAAATIPEPATFTLLMFGLPILYACKRKGRAAAK